MAVAGKLPDKRKVIEALNSSQSVRDAAIRLNVSRQALNRFISIHNIERYCEWREVKTIDAKPAASAKS